MYVHKFCGTGKNETNQHRKEAENVRIGNQEIKELQVINTEDDLIISITDDDVIELDGYKVVCVPKD